MIMNTPSSAAWLRTDQIINSAIFRQLAHLKYWSSGFGYVYRRMGPTGHR